MAGETGHTRRAVAVMNQKGGVGKTTTAVNLGAALAAAGRRVCLIDLDPQAHLTLHLGVDPGVADHTVYDLLIDPACEVSHGLVQVAERLHVLPAEVDLAAAETELAGRPDRQQILRRKFEGLSDEHDFLFIDCPPSLGLLTLNALALATEVFVPMQAHFLALQGLSKLLETVRMVSTQVNADLRVTGVILCMHDSQTTLGKEVVADLERFFEGARLQDVPWRGCRVLQPPVRRNVKLAEAPSFGQTIFDYSPRCAGAADYRRLAEHVIELAPLAPEPAALPPAPPHIVTVPAGEPATVGGGQMRAPDDRP